MFRRKYLGERKIEPLNDRHFVSPFRFRSNHNHPIGCNTLSFKKLLLPFEYSFGSHDSPFALGNSIDSISFDEASPAFERSSSRSCTLLVSADSTQRRPATAKNLQSWRRGAYLRNKRDAAQCPRGTGVATHGDLDSLEGPGRGFVDARRRGHERTNGCASVRSVVARCARRRRADSTIGGKTEEERRRA